MDDKNNILLINRDKDFLDTMAGVLRQDGYVVHTAMDMHEALTMLTSHPVKLIICDTSLQDISGYDFLRFLKNDPMRESIPFILFVPINDQGRAFKAFELGALDFLVYPMEVDDFLKRIQEIISSDVSEGKKSGSQKTSKITPSFPANKLQESQENRRRDDRTRPVPNLHIDLSRDEVVWIPGLIKNFGPDGIFVETSMLGKQGVILNIRVSLPQENITAKGNIKYVVFDDFEQPVGIGIQFDRNPEWSRIFNYLDSLLSSTAGKNEPAGQPHISNEFTRTILLNDDKGKNLNNTLLSGPSPKVEEVSYDTRFYHSLTGKQLDNYKVVSFIGSGTMGGVFKGLDSVLERVVALKVISYELSSQETFRKMFIKEARLISKLDHPNISHIYSIGSKNDILYFAMEFISGNTLADSIENNVNLNTLKGLDYLITICQTLDFVKQKNIIHRDIKPENIIINDKGVLKIVDFGVAGNIDVTANGIEQEGIVGSPLYISPDSITGHTVDHRSDIYSLGATFYHVLSGYPPFDGHEVKDILLKHINDKLIPLKEKNPKISGFLCNIIEKMLAKDPKDRYQNYQEIIQPLQFFRSKVLKLKKQKTSVRSTKLEK